MFVPPRLLVVVKETLTSPALANVIKGFCTALVWLISPCANDHCLLTITDPAGVVVES